MFHSSQRRRTLLVAALALLALTAAAVSYWSSTGSGTGTAGALESAQQPLTVNQTSVLSPMYPGDSAQTLSGDFDNPNAGPVYVTDVTASIAAVTKAEGAPAGECDASDFTLANATMAVGTQIPAGNAQGAWSGATIRFNNKTSVNQDACKGATVTVGYDAS